MKKIIITSTIVATIIVVIFLLWKFWPVNASQKLPWHSSRWGRGHDYRRRIPLEPLLWGNISQRRLIHPTAVGPFRGCLVLDEKTENEKAAPVLRPPPQSFPMEQLSTAPPAFNPIFLGQQRAISHEQPALSSAAPWTPHTWPDRSNAGKQGACCSVSWHGSHD